MCAYMHAYDVHVGLSHLITVVLLVLVPWQLKFVLLGVCVIACVVRNSVQCAAEQTVNLMAR